MVLNFSVTLTEYTTGNVSKRADHADPFVSTMGHGWDLAIALVILLIIVFGVFFNIVVLHTLTSVKATELRQQQLNSTDYYIIALATTDLAAILLCYPLTFVSTLSHRWLFGYAGCEVNAFCGFLFSLIDTGVLTMMAVVRLVSVKTPHSAFIKSPRWTMVILSCVVVYALVWTVSPLLKWGDFAPEPFGTSCTVNWKNPDRSYVTAVFTGVLLLPLLTMLGCYSAIVCHMRHSSVKLGRLTDSGNRRAKSLNRLIKMTVLMCACFLVVWLPYSVLSLGFSYVPNFEVPAVLSAIPTVLAKTSHVVNPLIYFTMNPTYRRRINCQSLRQFFSFRSRFLQNELYTHSDNGQSYKHCYHITQIPDSSYLKRSPITLRSWTTISANSCCRQCSRTLSTFRVTSVLKDEGDMNITSNNVDCSQKPDNGHVMSGRSVPTKNTATFYTKGVNSSTGVYL